MSTQFARCAQKSGGRVSAVGTCGANKRLLFFIDISLFYKESHLNNHVANCSFLDSCLGFVLRPKPPVKDLLKWGEIADECVVLNFGTLTPVFWSHDWNFQFFSR